jgi:hypothetical protein
MFTIAFFFYSLPLGWRQIEFFDWDCDPNFLTGSYWTHGVEKFTFTKLSIFFAWDGSQGQKKSNSKHDIEKLRRHRIAGFGWYLKYLDTCSVAELFYVFFKIIHLIFSFQSNLVTREELI